MALKIPSIITSSLLLIPVLFTIPTLAHKVEISNQVAGTLHIEPDDNPRMGEEVQAWFALTSRGGKMIPLSECNCQLSVYTLPRNQEDKPILNPILQAVNVGQYQEIPGALITFPQIGSYELEIAGTADNGANFQDFKLNYTVNVLP
ncbi:MAG: hypothetical protein QNJ55_11260 [Xenococcus sp. MO_188.B8]|nr:hypothetical protein [Xenococcus sp. MO_188.B8]